MISQSSITWICVIGVFGFAGYNAYMNNKEANKKEVVHQYKHTKTSKAVQPNTRKIKLPKNKRNEGMSFEKKLTIAIIFTVVMALAFFGLMFKIIIENGKCVDHPFEYSAEKLEESGGMYSCSCDSLDPELLDFTFDKEGINIIERDQPINEYKIDFSDLKITG